MKGELDSKAHCNDVTIEAKVSLSFPRVEDKVELASQIKDARALTSLRNPSQGLRQRACRRTTSKTPSVLNSVASFMSVCRHSCQTQATAQDHGMRGIGEKARLGASHFKPQSTTCRRGLQLSAALSLALNTTNSSLGVWASPLPCCCPRRTGAGSRSTSWSTWRGAVWPRFHADSPSWCKRQPPQSHRAHLHPGAFVTRQARAKSI